MANNDFSILLKAEIDKTNKAAIKSDIDVLSKQITPLKIKVDTNSIKSSIQNAIKEAYQNVSTKGIKLPTISGGKAGLSSTVSQYKSEYQQLMSIARQMGTLKFKIAGLDATQNKSEINVLTKQLNQFKTDYSSLLKSIGGNLSTEQWGKLQAAIDNADTKVNTLNAKLADTKVRMSEGIQYKIGVGDYETQISRVEQQFVKWGYSAEEVKTKIASLKTAYEAMKNAPNDDKRIEAEKAFQKVLDTTKNKITQTAVNTASSFQTQNLSNKIETWLNANTRASNTAKESLREYLATLRDGNVPLSQFKKIEQSFNNITTAERNAGRLGRTTGESIKAMASKFSTWIGASRIIMEIIRGVKQAWENVKELDDALTNISYTMDVSDAQLEKIGRTALETAKDLHTSTSNVLDAVKTYANANETAESILTKAKPTIMMSNVTGMNTEETVDILQGTMEQFDLTEDKLMHISDVMQTVSMSMPYDFSKGVKELSEGIQASGSVAYDAGYDLERYTALLGTLISKTRQSGSELGRSLRTMFVRTTKASTSALANGEVTEDDLSNAETALRRVGIEVRSDIDTFKSFDEIMGELYAKVDTLSDVDLSNIAYEVASKICARMYSNIQCVIT